MPYCLIVDVDMPEMTGLDLQRELRSLGVPLPTVVISARRRRCRGGREVSWSLRLPTQAGYATGLVGRDQDRLQEAELERRMKMAIEIPAPSRSRAYPPSALTEGGHRSTCLTLSRCNSNYRSAMSA